MGNKGNYPTSDGRFLGKLYECAICGFSYRKYEMVMQRGKLVCKEHCKDEPGHKPK